MSEVTRKVVFLICFVAVCAIRFYFARLVKQKKVVDGRKTAQEKLAAILNASRNVYPAFSWCLYTLVRVGCV